MSWGSPAPALDPPVEAGMEVEGKVIAPTDEREGRRNLKAESTSIAHLLTDWPKTPHSQSCQIAKAQRELARRRFGRSPRPVEFGDANLRAHRRRRIWYLGEESEGTPKCPMDLLPVVVSHEQNPAQENAS